MGDNASHIVARGFSSVVSRMGISLLKNCDCASRKFLCVVFFFLLQLVF